MSGLNADGAADARELVLALADDELCIGQNLAWWIAVGPFLEEDLALTSISQDELGHARALYGLLGDDIDTLAYGREPREYRSAHLTELPCRDWGETLVRHFLYDTAETIRWEALVDSSWEALVGVARRAVAEERSHLRHASGLLSRLLRTEVGCSQLLPLFDQFVPLACELFELPPGCSAGDLVAAGVMARPLSDQRAEWQSKVEEALAEVGYQPNWPEQSEPEHGETEPTPSGLHASRSAPAAPMSSGSPTSLAVPMSSGSSASPAASAPAVIGGRAGQRSPYFAALHAEMVEVLSIDPSAVW